MNAPLAATPALTLVHGADWPLTLSFFDAAGVALDLSGATVAIDIVAAGAVLASFDATIDDPASGIARTTIARGDAVQAALPLWKAALINIRFTDASSLLTIAPLSVKQIDPQEAALNGQYDAVVQVGDNVTVKIGALQGPAGAAGLVTWSAGSYVADRYVYFGTAIWRALRTTSVAPSDAAPDDWQKIVDLLNAQQIAANLAQSDADAAATAADSTAAASSASSAATSADQALTSAGLAQTAASQAFPINRAFDTLVNLQAFAPPAGSDDLAAAVFADPLGTNNGVYGWTGTAWTRRGNLLPQLAVAYRSNVPGLAATRVDGAGFAAEYYLDGARHSPEASRVTAHDTDIAALFTVTVAYRSNIPGLVATRVDGSGYLAEYYLNGVLHSPQAALLGSLDLNVAGLFTRNTAYRSNVPSLIAFNIDGAGFTDDYYLNGVQHAPSTPQLAALQAVGLPTGALNKASRAIVQSSDGAVILGVHRDGYGVLGPLPARDFAAFVAGEYGARQVWIEGGGVARRISTDEDGADCHSPSLSSTRLVFYAGDGVAAARKQVLLAGAAKTISDGVLIIIVTERYGQSNALGSENNALASAVPTNPGRVLMFNGGVRVHNSGHNTNFGNVVVNPANLRNFVDGYEQIQEGSGDSGTTTLANELLAHYGATAATLAVNAAIGSHAYEDLKKGTQEWANRLTALREARRIATINGYDFDAPCLFYNGNEGDIGHTPDQWAASLVELQADNNAAADAICCASKVRPLVMTQVGNNSAYSQPPNTAQGLLQAALANPDKIVCSGAGYIYPTLSATNVHKTAQGQVDTCRRDAKYFLRWLTGGDALPLYVVSAVRTANVIVLTFHLPPDATSLNFDTGGTVTDPGNQGVHFQQTGGNAPTIQSVAITAANQVTVTLDVTPTGTAQQIGIGWLVPVPGQGGPTVGSRSTIRDDAAALPDYACQQLIDVT